MVAACSGDTRDSNLQNPPQSISHSPPYPRPSNNNRRSSTGFLFPWTQRITSKAQRPDQATVSCGARLRNVVADTVLADPPSPINMSKPLDTHLYRRRRRKAYDIRTAGKNAIWITIGTTCALILFKYDPSHTKTLNPFSKLETTSTWIEDRCPAPMNHLDCLFWDPVWLMVQTCSQIETLTVDVWNKMVRLLAFPLPMESRPTIYLQEQLYPRLEVIPRLLLDPPPLLFIAAGLGFVIAITAFRYSHRGDRYQDYIHIVGMTLGVVVASQRENFLMAAKGCLAWSTILGLVVSVLLHRLLNTSSEVEQIE
jgi:hypothetical protein